MITQPRARQLCTAVRCGALSLLLLVGTPARAEDRSALFGLATERWYARSIAVDEMTPGSDPRPWNYGLYVDIGYGANFNDPGNKLWRSKGTTFRVNEPQVNLALAYLSKQGTPESRFGMEFGLQAGVDTENLVPSTPPAFNEPVSNADTLRHLYRANASYLFPVGDGLGITAGLINSYIGYESFLAIQNINYTRGYLLDFVPYFLTGVQGSYPVMDDLDISLFVVDGWNYLANANDTPSLGFQSDWQLSSQVKYIQNFYYGPDQDASSSEFWRFFSDSIVEWKSDRFILAGAFDFGTEKQADVIGNPHYDWMSGALWFGWLIERPWSLGLRAEFFSDLDGVATGTRQEIQAYTATLEYAFSPAASNTAVLALEYRFDRSTGPEGGFYKGEDNRLVPDQHQLFLSLMWTFGP